MNRLGRYDIIEEVGRGAMGIVYRGWDPKINRAVALKCLRPSVIELREGARKHFKQEMYALGRMIHPNIVTIFDAGEDPSTGYIYIVMEYVAGISLAQLLKENTSLSTSQTLAIGVQVCRGLGFAHSKGVIHRDIKPGNILLSKDLKTLKITDFGIARLDNTGLTHVDRLTGTPRYMSPEQCLGETLDERSDLFSVGSLLYELLTHQRAYPGKTVTSVIYQVLHDTPVPPSDVSSDVPTDVSDAVMKSMQKSREKRFSNGEEMAKALLSPELPANIDEAETLEMSRKAVSRALPLRWPQISRWQVAGLTAMFLIVIGMSVYFSKDQAVKEVRSAASPPVSEGLIALSTTPSGADILINGDLKGVSPLSLRLPPGSHDLVVLKEGYYSLEATLDSPSGKEVPINLRLMAEVLP